MVSFALLALVHAATSPLEVIEAPDGHSHSPHLAYPTSTKSNGAIHAAATRKTAAILPGLRALQRNQDFVSHSRDTGGQGWSHERERTTLVSCHPSLPSHSRKPWTPTALEKTSFTSKA